MAKLSGLILAGAFSEEDEIVDRLIGRNRYAMPLANRVLVRYAAEALVASGVTDVTVAVSPATIGDVCEMIGEGGPSDARFRYLEQPDTGTVLDTLRAARARLGIGDPLLVHSGDAIVTAGLRDVVADFRVGAPDVMLISEPSHCYPEAALAGARGLGRREHHLAGLEHVSPAAIISSETLGELDEFSAETDTLGGTVAALAEAGVNVVDRGLAGCWCYAGDCDHLLEANRMILDDMPHAQLEGELDSVRIEGRVAIHPTARLERTTVRGPAVIGGGAELVDTFLGPYSSIGPGARLEGAEVDHSIVLAGAAIRHPGHRLEASVIGAGAEIARDYGMPTAVRLQVGRRSAVMLA